SSPRRGRAAADAARSGHRPAQRTTAQTSLRRRRREVHDRQRGDPRRTGSPRAVPPAARPAGGLPAPSLGGRAAGPGSSPPAAHARRPRPRPQGHAPMDFSRFFIDRPIFAAVLSIVIFAAGLISIPLLPIGEYPEVVPPS